MRTRIITALLSIAFIGAATSSVVRSAGAHTAAVTEQFWACDPGFTMELNASNAAHCEKPAGTRVANLNSCPSVAGIGLFPSVDRVNGTKDMCTGINPVTGEISAERGCPLGYTKTIVTGTDRCEQRFPKEIRQPTVPVNRTV